MQSIETDTPLLPFVIAEAVVQEAQVFLQCELPEGCAVRLAAKAEHLYEANRDVRRKLRAAGNAGREYLYAFMRHWLYGLLKAEQPRLAARLPERFANGLPC